MRSPWRSACTDATPWKGSDMSRHDQRRPTVGCYLCGLEIRRASGALCALCRREVTR